MLIRNAWNKRIFLSTPQEAGEYPINQGLLTVGTSLPATLILSIIIPLIICQSAFATTASYYNLKSCHREGTSGIMANGRKLNDESLTCASWDYPFGARIRVTNLENNRSVICEVTDRGPAKKLYRLGRTIDLSERAMRELDGIKRGIIKIKVERIK